MTNETMESASSFVVSLTILARYGGYSTIAMYLLSVVIMTMAYYKRASFVAYTFLIIVLLQTIFIVSFQYIGLSIALIHMSLLVKIIPYLLILYMLIKVERPATFPAGAGRVNVPAARPES